MISPRNPAVSVTVALSLALLTIEEARAEEPSAPPRVTSTTAAAPVVIAPERKTDPGVQYPEQALKERWFATATVVLILEIDATGAVRKVAVESPQGHGFDEAAMEAANLLTFAPAERNGSPVAARIKYTYVFRPPPPRLVGRVARKAADSPVGGAEIVVRASDGALHTTTTASDGTWAVDKLPSGPVQITATAQGLDPQSIDDELTPSEETSVVLRLEPSARPDEPRATARAASPVPVQEVIVRGERPPREVTKRTLEKEEIALIPGTNGDALRSIQSLPGVARPPPFTGLLVVRGSAPQDTTTFVDGTPVPLIYHFGGLSSVVPTELLEKIDFYPGNYSTVYGRGMAGMVDVGIRDPKKDGLHGMLQVDLIDARVLVEGPIGNTGWNFLLAGRRSWVDAVLGPVLGAAGAGVTTAPRYYDYQAMLQKDIDSRSSFRVLFFGSNDALEILNQSPSASNPTLSGTLSGKVNFWRVQARYQNKLTDSTEIKVSTSVGQDSIDIGFGKNVITTSEIPISGRVELSQKVVRGVTAHVGIDVNYSPYEIHARYPQPNLPGAPSGGPLNQTLESTDSGSRFFPGIYTEWELSPLRGMRIVPGLRVDYASSTQTWDVSPRVTARQDLTRGFPRTTLKGGAGLFYQPPGPMQTDPTFGQPGLTSNRAAHYDLGFEQELSRQVELSMDGFYKRMDHLVTQGAGNVGDGHAYGAEWLLRYKPDGRFFGWLAYTLSRSERRAVPSDPLSLFQYDQTHILTVLGSYKLPLGFQVGARFRLVSGGLYTPNYQGAFDATSGTHQAAPAFPPYGERLPPFHQLDLRVDRTWKFKAWSLTAYLDVQNVYNQPNAEGVTYNYNYTQSSIVSGLPILPSLGLRGEL